MGSTYRAVEVSSPGVLRVVERPISKAAAGQVRLRVEACGVCHSDLATVQGDNPGHCCPKQDRGVMSALESEGFEG
jgi:propanol-preferring alcohol dehydrogenase